MVLTNTHAKDHGQRSFGSKVRVETDEQTELIALRPVPTGQINKITRKPSGILSRL